MGSREVSTIYTADSWQLSKLFLFLLNIFIYIYAFQKESGTLEWFVSNGIKISTNLLPLPLLWGWCFLFKERQDCIVGRWWILEINMNLKPGWLSSIHVVVWIFIPLTSYKTFERLYLLILRIRAREVVKWLWANNVLPGFVRCVISL